MCSITNIVLCFSFNVYFIHFGNCNFFVSIVTLLSGEPEIQFVALRNINLIVQKR